MSSVSCATAPKMCGSRVMRWLARAINASSISDAPDAQRDLIRDGVPRLSAQAAQSTSECHA